MTVLEALRRVTESIKAWTEKKITTQTVTATSDDGIAYTATISGIETLTVGANFIMIPGTVSKSTTPTLNVNGLGAKPVRRRLSSLPTSLQSGYNASWLTANKPFRMFYDGTAWIVEDQTKPAAADLSGTVPKANADADGNVIADTYATKIELQNLLPKVTSITLGTTWSGTSSPYYQDVTLSCVTETSVVDLQPTPEQLASWQDDGLAFTTLSGNGQVRVYVAGGLPASSITVQVKVQEVVTV
jgi:hypothetical protein